MNRDISTARIIADDLSIYYHRVVGRARLPATGHFYRAFLYRCREGSNSNDMRDELFRVICFDKETEAEFGGLVEPV